MLFKGTLWSSHCTVNKHGFIYIQCFSPKVLLLIIKAQEMLYWMYFLSVFFFFYNFKTLFSYNFVNSHFHFYLLAKCYYSEFLPLTELCIQKRKICIINGYIWVTDFKMVLESLSHKLNTAPCTRASGPNSTHQNHFQSMLVSTG